MHAVACCRDAPRVRRRTHARRVPTQRWSSRVSLAAFARPRAHRTRPWPTCLRVCASRTHAHLASLTRAQAVRRAMQLARRAPVRRVPTARRTPATPHAATATAGRLPTAQPVPTAAKPTRACSTTATASARARPRSIRQPICAIRARQRALPVRVLDRRRARPARRALACRSSSTAPASRAARPTTPRQARSAC